MVHQKVVRHQIGIKRVAPRIDIHVDHHVLGAGHSRIVDKIVDPPKGLDRRIHRSFQRIEVADVNTA